MTKQEFKFADEIIYTERPEINREFLRFGVPGGCDDIGKISHKIINYKGKSFKFAGWNSDERTCCFYRVMSDG
jgi:hypothetical protein